ncbi:MAG: glycosyltransferase WbuB [Flavobacterium psychrophilum]|nr:MAG: glycosyltransferase WbuB [Flavobacterium psychrophilum]
MKVLLVTQYFYPENFKSNDIAFELKKRGHEVTVLTGLPNYPSGKLFPGYGFFGKRKEIIDGVTVIRASLFLRGKGGGIRLFLNYFSWAYFASVRAFFLGLTKKYDAVIVHEPSPITQGFPAIVYKKLRKVPVYFWVLDLWPESLESAGGIKNKYVLGFFKRMVQYIYNNSDKILISSKGFATSILEKGKYQDKLVYFPNWAEDAVSAGESNYPIPALPDGFKVMFAGNIGVAQDIEAIMNAALELKANKDIHFVIVGDGRSKEWAAKFAEQNGLTETVHFVGRFPIEAMKTFFDNADALLVTLKDEPIFNVTVPAKMQAYLSVGKPILSMLNGEGSEIIKESASGLTANAGDYKQLSKNILELYAADTVVKQKMGESAKEYYNANFKLDVCISNLENIIAK